MSERKKAWLGKEKNIRGIQIEILCLIKQKNSITTYKTGTIIE